MSHPLFEDPDGKAYEVVLCGSDASDEGEGRDKCNRQATRDHNNDWECPKHGRCPVVRFAKAVSVRVTLG